MTAIVFSASLLVTVQALVFILPGTAVAAQRALFRGFDLSTAFLSLFAAEAFLAFVDSGILGAQLDARAALAVVGALGVSTMLGVGWNVLLERLSRLISLSGAELFVISLGAATAAAGLVGALRGGGLRTFDGTSFSVTIGNVPVAATVIGLVVVGATVLLGIRFWLQSSQGLGLELLSEDRQLAIELGLDRTKVGVVAGVWSGLASGVAGCYLAASSGSTPDMGMGVFLGGAGAAFLFRGRLLSKVLVAGLVLGAFRVGVEYLVSPPIANALLFTLILAVLLWRGTERTFVGVR